MVEEIAMLRDALRTAMHAVDVLGSVAERESSAFTDTKNRVMDKGYAALRATNHLERKHD